MCDACGDIIESKHRHDFQKCTCGVTFIDGGNDYIRAGGKPIFIDYEETTDTEGIPSERIN